MPTTPRAPAEIGSDLRRLGVQTGDLLMVHASLRSIGPLEGGADGLLEALVDTVGLDGTLLMVLGALDEWAWVNERPEPERAQLLSDAEPFDALATPADPEVGTLAEVFRTRPGTLVSDHPEGRFAASGRLAGHLTTDVPWNDYYGPGSPLERLVDAGGRVLRLGADPNTVTLLHYAEYLTPLPEKRRVRRHRKVLEPGGSLVRVVECLDDSAGIVDYPAEDYFTSILRAYLGTDRAACGMVGDAQAELIDAGDIARFAVHWMAEHLGEPNLHR
ncbi:MAG: AAC(3) family N-acetyltransferase [Acidimicrobiia bacterium]|nr:AAC(3) family N-acetyltransferase [Acidimicrobiia bacterium]